MSDRKRKLEQIMSDLKTVSGEKTEGRRVFFVGKIKDGVEQRRAKQTNDNISDSEQCLRTFMQNISKDINKSINCLNRRIKQMEDIF